MKAILMSIRPEWVCKILNKEKTVEIRKKFPSDYVGWVYIYCTKQNDLFKSYIRMGYYTTRSTADDLEYNGKGKVVARFWCDKVEEIKGMFDELNREYAFENEKDLFNKSCLERDELGNYLKIYNNNDYEKVGYAIHITNLEIFDKPKEISEFSIKVFPHRKDNLMTRYLTRAPQSWQFIEV